MNLVSFQTTILLEIRFYQFVSLFGRIGAGKLQNPLSKKIQLDCLSIFRKIDKQIAELNRLEKKKKINNDKDG